jgi:hypothetical protein
MRNVFLYWVGNEYKLIKILRQLIYLHSTNGTGYTVHLINHENLTKYIPTLPKQFFKLKPAHQADYVRVYTVCKHGGIWLDADTIVMGSLDGLFEMLEKGDGFFIRQNNEELCNGVFGSRADTVVMREWLQAIDIRLEDTATLEFTELGAKFLNKKLEASPHDFDNYVLLNGLDNVYPVNWDRCVEEYLEAPADHAQTLVRPFQPLVILVNSVYVKVEPLSDIWNGTTPLAYFLKKSYWAGMKAYALLILSYLVLALLTGVVLVCIGSQLGVSKRLVPVLLWARNLVKTLPIIRNVL